MPDAVSRSALEAIDREVAELERRLRDLHRRRRLAGRAWRGELVAAFDAGESIGALADRHGITYRAAQAVLYRAGRTLAGREAVQHQINVHVARNEHARSRTTDVVSFERSQ